MLMRSASSHLDLKSLPKGAISSLSYLRPYLAPYRLMIMGAMLALIITSSSVLGLGYALRHLVDEGIGKGNVDFLTQSYAVLMMVIALLAFTTYARYFLVTWVGEKVVANIRNDMYRHLIHLDVSFFETHRIGDLLSRLTTDTTLIQTVVGSSVSIALRNALMLVGGIVMLCVTSLELTAYVMLIVPFVVAPILVLGKKVRHLSRASQDRIADINAHAEETLAGIQTIHAFTLEQREETRFLHHIDESLTTSYKRIRVRAMLTAIVITLVLGAISTVLFFGGQRVITGDISVGELSSFVFYAMIVAGSIGAISEVVGDLQRAAGAVERLAELKAEHSSLSHTDTPERLPDSAIGNIAFEEVVFHYPSRPDEAALKGISFTIERGQTVAFVGTSGSGKSTIFRLLLRYYDPNSGRITLEGCPLSSLTLQELRTRMGVVQQDTVIFSSTAYENIAIGRDGATREEVIAAARDAEILDFLESLPDGLDSYLGEKGIRLSGGQKQRIAIARALVRSPDILLLDEATSALDSDNEQKVQQALSRVMQGRTTLVIAHRLSTVRNADKIILIDKGVIAAEGTHDALIASNALYQKLAAHQFKEPDILAA
jgi:ATP-binding cassette, subfamily B, bacterial